MSTRYMFLIYGDENRIADATPADWDQMLQAHNAWSASVAAAGATVVSGEALSTSGTSTTVRQTDNGPVLTDGPFIETKEALGGYYVVDCTDLDQALAFARTLPSEVVEVRPVNPDGLTLRVLSAAEVSSAVEQAHRTEWGLVLASVARLLDGDLATAEECTQEAFVAALETWGERGIPARPGAWLTTTARRRALDRVRRESGMRERYPDLVRTTAAERTDDPAELADEEDSVVVDDRLRLVFTCCHPSLAAESRVALTLRMVCGLSTPEIARAFLVPEATMAARITRAKKKITAAGVPYRVPYGSELPDRLDGVLTVIHLVFTTGYAAEGPDLVRADLVERALDLARVLAVLMPDEPEALGLLALLELTDARRDARVDDSGALVLLEDQDRSRWDRVVLEHGVGLLDRALLMTRPGHPAGRFTLQAAIAAVHDEAATWAQTDWLVILALYERLLAVWPTAVVRVNRAVALSFATSPSAGLAELELISADPALRSYHYLPSARADLLRRAGRPEEAAEAYADALALVPDGQERAFLERRLAEVSATPGQ